MSIFPNVADIFLLIFEKQIGIELNIYHIFNWNIEDTSLCANMNNK